MAQIINGKEIADRILEEVKQDASKFSAKHKRKPGLAVVLVGDDVASEIYVRYKTNACARVGIESFVHKRPACASEAEVLALINKLNKDKTVDGILVQLPLPLHIDKQKIISLINPKKDVDGFTPENMGKLTIGEQDGLFPCTPVGVMKMLEVAGVSIEGKNATIVGASNIVGKPMAIMLLNKNATITSCHIYTKDLKEHTKKADILIVAVGKAGLITKDHVKKGAVVIDVGINRLADKKICGDVCFEEVCDCVDYISPVPRGVGPMTVAMLMSNTIKAA
ncbi:MAG: bifunctional methylenetetrahydrofolate dehydrogenase/methenyltetrahydrofolate cyclohydrolase FolD, partial [Firmicutes bacterium]|nr:bifunctional methylenetetrahydrofolate dehydrogenase/methenyltetrahydrofolate cyclohydrolase FolD [Bacillota bacterium]